MGEDYPSGPGSGHRYGRDKRLKLGVDLGLDTGGHMQLGRAQRPYCAGI